MITFLKPCSFPVHTSESDSTTEYFKPGDLADANIISTDKTTVDLQFSDGSYAFNIPKKIFKEGKTTVKKITGIVVAVFQACAKGMYRITVRMTHIKN